MSRWTYLAWRLGLRLEKNQVEATEQALNLS